MQAPALQPLTRILLARAGIEARQASSAPSTSTESIQSAAGFYIPHLPGLPQAAHLRLYAGHLPATTTTDAADSDAHLFFLLAKAKHIADRQRLVLWLNGGPGCSSFDGALMEIGPVRMSKDQPGELVENAGAWNEYANVLFLDQPAGTGYSYINRGAPVTELAPASDQVITFLENFYNVFPETEAYDLYLAGESYAGQYIPYIASAILKTTRITAPLKGLLMGNAWLDPAVQYPAYLEFSLQEGIIAKDSPEAKRAEEVDKNCNATLESSGKGRVLVPECEGLLGAVLPNPDQFGRCVNAYNTRILEPCGSAYPADAIRVKPYLRTEAVVSAFHATSKPVPWDQCNDTISGQMWSPASRPSVELLPDLLDQNVEILLFAGELDVVCNWLGVERTIAGLTWLNEQGMNTTIDDWYVNNTRAGTWQSDRGLHWVRVANASHMVAIEKPLEAHDLLLRFANITPLAAAGATAKVPSRLGEQTVSILGLIAPDGRTLNTSFAESGNLPLLSDPASLEDDTAADISEQDREAYYGPRRSAALAILILTVIILVGLVIRWRTSKKSAVKVDEVREQEEMQKLVEEGHERQTSERSEV